MIYPRRIDGKPSMRYPRCDISDLGDDEELAELKRKVEQDEHRRGN